MWKTTFVASGYICFASYILAVAKVAVFIHNLPIGQISLQRNITAVGNITA